MTNDFIIIGYSGHSYVICDICHKNGANVLGYCDNVEKEFNPFELKYLGSEMDFQFKDEFVFIAIGDNIIRRNIYNSLLGKVIYGSAIHPNAVVGYDVQCGEMIMLGANAVLNPLCKIGNGVIVNTGAIVEHECLIGNFVHIAPNAILAGGVKIGENTFIGAGAVVKQGINVCSDVMIGAGAVVLNDITDSGIYVGTPARKK